MAHSNDISRNKLKWQMQEKQVAYQKLAQGSAALLKAGTLFWTERLLLKIVAWLAQQRLGQLAEVLDGE